jgi:hypothetical protein
MGASDLIALAALAAAAVSIWRTEKYARTTDRLNRLLIEKETEEAEAQERPDVSGNFVKVGRLDWRFKIFNRGTATARNVTMDVEEGHDIFLRGDMSQKLPIPILERHQHVDLLVSATLGGSTRSRVTLRWENERGTHFSKQLTPILS